MKIIFWGSSDFSIPALKMLFDQHEVIAVVTKPDKAFGRGLKKVASTQVKEFAVYNFIDVLQPADLHDDEFYKKLVSYNADMFVIVSYGKIIPESILKIPPRECINLHASLLPKYRGPSPIHAAFLNGDKITGNTVQYVSKEMDKGDIIISEEMAIEENDNYITLSEKLAFEGGRLVLNAIDIIEDGLVIRVVQEEELSSYCKMISKEDGLVDFKSDNAEYIRNKYRAYMFWPGIHTEYHHNPEPITVNLNNVEFDFSMSNFENPGTILQADKNALRIALKEGEMKILELKPAGKNDMDYLSFINGYKPKVGEPF